MAASSQSAAERGVGREQRKPAETEGEKNKIEHGVTSLVQRHARIILGSPSNLDRELGSKI